MSTWSGCIRSWPCAAWAWVLMRSVAALSDTRPPLADVMRHQLAQVDDRIDHDERLRQRLRSITAAMPQAGDPSATALLDIMEMITITDNTATRIGHLMRSSGALTAGHITELTEEFSAETAHASPGSTCGIRPTPGPPTYQPCSF